MATPQEIVQEVLLNKYGAGETRKQKLRDAGYSWIEIQSLINKQFGSRPVAASNSEIAQEVKEGRWGKDNEWKDRVAAAGFDAAAVANLVKSGSSTTTSSGSAAQPSSSSAGAALISTQIQSKGIDISAWQGTVDFNQVKAAGVQFVILREGYSTTIDNKFLEYVRGATAAGIPIHGVYHFCYATTKEGAIQEAQSCLSNVAQAGLPKSTIIFFDFEYDTVNNAKKKGVVLTKQHCIDFTNAFLSTIAAHGYKTGVYCNLDYYRNMYDVATTSKYILWIAQWTKGEPSVKGAYHQYSDQGRVAGINANVDLDNCYIRSTSDSSFTPDPGPITVKPSYSTSVSTDFDKYAGKISNCGKDEYGGISGGRAGDQSGKEWWIINWYSQGWQCILRHPDPNVRHLIAELAIEAAQNDNVGYDQSENQTFWQQLQRCGYRPKNITTPCEADCSAGVVAITKAAGNLLNKPELANINASYTGNMRAGYSAAGFQVLTDRKYLNGPDYLLPGDIILNDSQHTATNLGYGKYADRSRDEAATAKPSVPDDSSSSTTGTAAKTVNVDMLNIRNGAGPNNGVIGQVPRGTKLNVVKTVTGSDGQEWAQIKINSFYGYVVAQYLS